MSTTSRKGQTSGRESSDTTTTKKPAAGKRKDTVQDAVDRALERGYIGVKAGDGKASHE